MTSDVPNADSDLPEQGSDPQPRSNRQSASRQVAEVDDFATSKALGFAWIGILIAAALYPIVLAGLVTIWLTFLFGVEPLSANDLGGIVGFLMLSLVIGTVYGFIMSIPAFLLTQLAAWSLKGIVSNRGVSGIYGGMTGFLCTSGGGLFFRNAAPVVTNLSFYIRWALACLLAVVMGHVGAIMAGYLFRNSGFPFSEPVFSFEKQITIGYLMKLTLIVAVLSIILKAAGTAGLYIGLTWVAYLLSQTLLLGGDHWITSWRRRTSET